MDMPVGTIILWKSGAIPSGWAVYNDAVGRFPRGAGAGANPGLTGGMETHVHALGAVSIGGDHSHGTTNFEYGTGSANDTPDGGSQNVARGDHTHTASFTMGTAGAHGHTMTAANTGSASNLPRYKTLIYIIKVGA